MEKYKFLTNICDHKWIYVSPKHWICKLCKKEGVPCEHCEGSGEYCGDICLFCDGFGIDEKRKETHESNRPLG